MKLLIEAVDAEFLKEESSDGKHYYIKGIFLQGNLKNKNGRMYPMPTLQKAVANYVAEQIHTNRAVGELGHPAGPTINYDKVSHKILELNQEGENFIGKALIVDTPNGKIVQKLLDAGIQLGVSSRGMGSIQSVGGIDRVQNDFILATAADIVADPSAPDAFVSGIQESKEWTYSDGVWSEQVIEETKGLINEKKILKAFEKFFGNMGRI